MEQFILDITKFFQNFDIIIFFTNLTMIWLLIYIIISVFLAYKTYQDSKKRYSDQVLIFTFTAFVFVFNFIGYIVYAIIRPKDLIQEQYMVNMEKFFLEYETRGIGKCKVCKHVYFPEHTYCTNCGTVVKTKCSVCSNIIELEWKVCPYCGDKKKIEIENKNKSKKEKHS